jgi:hypothetical protein
MQVKILAFIMPPYNFQVGLNVLMVASMKMAVFWVVAPCCLVEVYRRFRSSCCLHDKGYGQSSVYFYGIISHNIQEKRNLFTRRHKNLVSGCNQEMDG